MFAIHYYENRVYVFNHASNTIPSAQENVRIKGRNAKVLHVDQMGDQKYAVTVEFEKIVEKKSTDPRDSKKKKR